MNGLAEYAPEANPDETKKKDVVCLALLADYSSFVRILLSGGFCTCIYLAIVVGLFRLVEPIRVAGRIVQDLIGKR